MWPKCHILQGPDWKRKEAFHAFHLKSSVFSDDLYRVWALRSLVSYKSIKELQVNLSVMSCPLLVDFQTCNNRRFESFLIWIVAQLIVALIHWLFLKIAEYWSWCQQLHTVKSYPDMYACICTFCSACVSCCTWFCQKESSAVSMLTFAPRLSWISGR